MAWADPFGRQIDYVRLSVTDKCNLRCFYCMPERHRSFITPSHYLTFDEIERVVAAFSDLGVSRIRLTGGEPLVRKGLPDLITRLTAIPGIRDLSMSTNAMLLGKLAETIYKAGVSRLNVSLDTLKQSRFSEISRGGKLEDVLSGLASARQAGFEPIKINMLVMKGINDDEAVDLASFCIANGFALRFIETMPMGASGQEAYGHYLDLSVIRDQLAERFDLVPSVMAGGGPARYFRVNGTETHIGFITPLSQHFCATCNRVRMSADGTLHLCLGNSHNMALRPHLRDGISDSGLRDLLIEALAMKPWQHNFEDQPNHMARSMATTGG
ncbi:GTP 3',8-cyclase MoaA [uncultured Cohaesibacter sp.]|uniref:GTP 3',8-cyclase MoaA n=1 Tax=uncultured Cohaesibacter sp. TaxID=1002546 RepID=UPI0029C93730|nr:GTP 3',8-cyclase MoaA [uncultured Cohaesibacter sp.]